jgi:DNA repair protein RecN (Recombination protein N)
MLCNLHIENVAVVSKVDIEFGAGFNVLTGETGAGKSIIIDAINMVMGAKTSKDLIRKDATSAYVSALFSDVPPSVNSILEQFGIESEEDGSVLLQRELNISGRGTCRVNARPVPVSVLRDVSYYLLNIHGQNDNQSLLQSENHISFLDQFAQLETEIARYLEQYYIVNELQAKIHRFQMNQSDKAHKIDLYTFQTQELERAALRPDEEEDLLARRNILANAQKILTSVSDTKQFLYDGAEQNPSAHDQISGALSSLQPIVRLDGEFEKCYDKLSELLYVIEDCVDLLRSKSEDLDFSTQTLDEIEARLDIISRLKRKYAMNVTELLAYQEKITGELEGLKHSDETVAQLHTEYQAQRQQLHILAKELTEKRKASALRFEKAVMEELSFLDMSKVKFHVGIFPVIDTESGEIKFTPKGADKVEFMICANAGEDLKPLSKTASGGELSRIMLALKNVLNNQDEVATLIFDEIDSGISGRAANKVAQKLYMVSRFHQVLCVTHLVQIASFADKHFLIAKTSDDISTHTTVAELNIEQRKHELARIIASSEITDLTLQNAKEMLEISQKYKKEKLEEPIHGSI